MDEPENFKALSVDRVTTIFEDCFGNAELPLVAEVLYWYQFHSFPGHSCEHPFTCYGEDKELYYQYPRSKEEYARMGNARQVVVEDRSYTPGGRQEGVQLLLSRRTLVNYSDLEGRSGEDLTWAHLFRRLGLDNPEEGGGV